jgi:hypothetical protein
MVRARPTKRKQAVFMTPEVAPNQPLPILSLWLAWRNAFAITLLGCLLPGLGCFVLLGRVLPARMDLFHAAVWQEIGFGVAMAIILAVIVWWQRARGLTLRELGWRQPASPAALIGGVLLGVLYLWGSYFGAHYVLPGVNVLEFSWVRLALVPLGLFLAMGEETMMRGFFMTELHRARVPAWMQIFASGACSASYHTLQNPTLEGFLPSFVLFSLHAALYVFARRSLTPTILAHSMYHAFGEPYLLMMALTAMPR